MIADKMGIRRLLHGVTGLARALLDNSRGNVLMLTGFTIVPLTFATGMGIDYSRAMRVQTKLNAVADAAALAAVTQPMMAKSILKACDAATRSFVTQSSGLDGVVLNTADTNDFSVSITDTFASGSPVTLTCPAIGVAVAAPVATPLSRSAVVTFDGDSTNSFARILGVASLTIKGSSTTKASLAPFIDIHMALDTSQSMGLAASDADAIKLWEATEKANGAKHACSFACHAFAGAEPGSPNESSKVANDDIASLAGVKIRVDSLKDATLEMIDTAKTLQAGKELYRFGLYRIGDTTSDIAALSTDLSSIRNTASSLTLGPNDSTGYGDTNLAHMTNYVLPKIVAKGDGTTQAKARAFLFIVTDGVQDVFGNGCVHRHCMATINPATCNAYKNANVTVGVVYTTYLPVRKYPKSLVDFSMRGEYTDLIEPLPPSTIAPKLQACASPGWFFEASDGAGIQAAMQKLFSQASKSATIVR